MALNGRGRGFVKSNTVTKVRVIVLLHTGPTLGSWERVFGRDFTDCLFCVSLS